MPNRSPASLLRWLFCCAICLSTLDLRAQEPKPVIVVESWVAAIDFQKLRSLDLTGKVGRTGKYERSNRRCARRQSGQCRDRAKA